MYFYKDEKLKYQYRYIIILKGQFYDKNFNSRTQDKKINCVPAVFRSLFKPGSSSRSVKFRLRLLIYKRNKNLFSEESTSTGVLPVPYSLLSYSQCDNDFYTLQNECKINKSIKNIRIQIYIYRWKCSGAGPILGRLRLLVIELVWRKPFFFF